MGDNNKQNIGWLDFLFKSAQVAVPVFIAIATVVIVPWCRGIEERLLDAQESDYAIDARVIRLEGFANQGDRFTASMGAAMKLELQNEWLKEIGEIRRQIDQLPQTLQMPPVWWEQYVKSEIKRIEQKIDSHEKGTP